LSITEQGFRKFSNLLYQTQGPILKQLSNAVEPALTALISGSLTSGDFFPIEYVEVSVIEGLPKGSPAIIEHLMGWVPDRRAALRSPEAAQRILASDMSAQLTQHNFPSRNRREERRPIW
jgi:hypothetical protein